MAGKSTDGRELLRTSWMDPRFDLTSPLQPGNSAAAIILVGGRYLLQLRDAKRDIFFPAHWGCFGGAAEGGESPPEALARELGEELNFEVQPAELSYFTRFDFDYAFAALRPSWRCFYEVEMAAEQLPGLTLNEGSGMQLFFAESLLTGEIPLMPYDAHALWLHISRHRLVA